VSETQEATAAEGAATAELEVLADIDFDPDDDCEEETEALLDAREIEDEADDGTFDVEEILEVAEAEVELGGTTDREVDDDEDDDDEALDPEMEVETRDDDGGIEDEGVTITPLTFRGILRFPSPVDRYNATLFHWPQFWAELPGQALEQN
jgi:hypothetical protein